MTAIKILNLPTYGIAYSDAMYNFIAIVPAADGACTWVCGTRDWVKGAWAFSDVRPMTADEVNARIDECRELARAYAEHLQLVAYARATGAAWDLAKKSRNYVDPYAEQIAAQYREASETGRYIGD